MTVKELEEIEVKLQNFKYDEIPNKFIKLVEQKFSTYAYLKSLLEMKRGEL
jgi:hypothetical protein|tara:strand:- start:1114 stop:1266 length:153 start_codon:yes stop_codon:yes gene_type:complete